MEKDILAIDVGTTAFKFGIFGPNLEKKYETSRDYSVNLYDNGKADIEPEKWWQALKDCCEELKDCLSTIDVISLSVTTPGLVPLSVDGKALGPAILFFDGRSNKQAEEIRQKIGEEKFLRETCNLPVSGGSSLSSILWIRENQPDVWNEAVKFGHCNTYIVKRLTGKWAIDPSTTSITGLYNTSRHNLTWNEDILSIAELPQTKLPPLMESYQKVGEVLPGVATELGLPKSCSVLCGGNDAVLAALSGGVINAGDINNIAGTCEITCICVDKPISSREFNLRCHVIPNRWLTLFVLNTGGIALDWFHSVLCSEMTKDEFFNDYVPSVLEDFLKTNDQERVESNLPFYIPFLQGSRYSLKKETAGFSDLTLETTREKMLLGLIKGNAVYHKKHLEEVSSLVKLGRSVVVSGGVTRIRGILEAKKHWMGDFEYRIQDQSSLTGAAILGYFYHSGKCNLPSTFDSHST